MSLLAKIASLRQVNINAHAEIEALKETLSYAAEMGLRPSSLIDEIKTLKLSLADRDEEVKTWEDKYANCERNRQAILDEIKTLKKENKTLKDDDDRWEANCLYAEEWEDKYANCVLGMKKKNEIYADTGGDDDYRQAILDEIKALHWRAKEWEKANKALKLSLADKIHTKMNDEVVIMCRKEINTLKVQLADGDRSTLSTHEHHRELRDKLVAEIETLKLYADRRRAEIKTLKKDFDEFDWRGGSLKVEIDCLTQCLGERDEEIKTLKDVLANYATAKVVRGMGVVFTRKKVAETEE